MSQAGPIRIFLRNGLRALFLVGLPNRERIILELAIAHLPLPYGGIPSTIKDNDPDTQQETAKDEKKGSQDNVV